MLETCDNAQEKDDEILEELAISLAIVEECRYGVPSLKHSVPMSVDFLTDILPTLDEARFRQIVRVSWTNFKVILELIRNDEVFTGPRSVQQFPVEVQLIVVLYRLGSSGEGASVAKIACLFGLGDGGTLQRLTNRVFQAIIRLMKQFLYWPDAEERQNIVLQTFHELPHCVGYVDGMEIKLAEKPLQDPEAYFSRKHIYSLKVQAVCDHKLRIRHLMLGYPGSVHDSRIFKNCSLATKSSQYFNGDQWIAGDSAYKLSSTVLTPYRATSSEDTLQQRTAFNKVFSRYRMRIEHCFGLMKERFNSLKELKFRLGNDSSIKFACDWVLVCGILHNIILQQKENDDIFVPSDEPTPNTSDGDETESTNLSTVEVVKRREIAALLN